jgi:hypothetical protein
VGAYLGGTVGLGEGVFLGLAHAEVGVDWFLVGGGRRGGHEGWLSAVEGVGHEADRGVLGLGSLGGGDGVCVALLAGNLACPWGQLDTEGARAGDGCGRAGGGWRWPGASQAVAAGAGFHHEVEVVGVLVGQREAAVGGGGCGDVLGREGDLIGGGGLRGRRAAP